MANLKLFMIESVKQKSTNCTLRAADDSQCTRRFQQIRECGCMEHVYSTYVVDTIQFATLFKLDISTNIPCRSAAKEVPVNLIHSTTLLWASKVYSRASCLFSSSSRDASFWYCSNVKISLLARLEASVVTSMSWRCALKTVTMARLCTADTNRQWYHSRTFNHRRQKHAWVLRLPYDAQSAVIGHSALKEEYKCHNYTKM